MRFTTARMLAAVVAVGVVALSACSAGSGTESSNSPSSAPTESSDAGQQTDSAEPDSSDSGEPTESESETAPPATDTTLTLGLVLEPVSLDFTTVAGAAIPQVLLGNVYETLVVQQQDGSIAPGLAESWTVSDDGKTYDFTLREGVTFSDGSPFTAEEAAFSLNNVKNWTVKLTAPVQKMESAEAVSPTELKVTLSEPSNLWLFAMTTRFGAMMSPDHVGDLATEAIGTGPYTYADWKHGDSITLVRNDSYWGNPAPVKTVVFKYFTDPTAMNSAMLTGDIQVITTVAAPEALAQFENNPQFTIIQGTTNGQVLMAMNQQKAPLNDLKVRQAINYALDKPALLKAAWGGYGEIIGSHEVPTDPWYVDLNDVYPHDVAKAKELLAEAGAENIKLSLKIAAPLPYAVAAAPIVVSQLAEAGITVEPETISWDSWLENVYGGDHDYDLTIVNHVEQFDVVTVFTGKEGYYTQYINPEVTKLEEEGDKADYDTFIADFQQVMRILADDAAGAWLWGFPNLMVADSNVHGLPQNAIGDALLVSDLYVD